MTKDLDYDIQKIADGMKKLDAGGDYSILPPIPLRHPLQYRWSLWFLKADRRRDWEDCLHKVTTFDTVEDFWSVVNHITSPSALNWGSDYCVFKEQIRPMWEDPANVDGGRWLLQVNKIRRRQILDRYWLELLMAMVGEQFGDYGVDVCGAVLNVRQKGDKISLWTRDATQDNINSQIGKIFKAKLQLPDDEMLKYEVHKDASRRTSSIVKPKIVIQGGNGIFKLSEPPKNGESKGVECETKQEV